MKKISYSDSFYQLTYDINIRFLMEIIVENIILKKKISSFSSNDTEKNINYFFKNDKVFVSISYFDFKPLQGQCLLVT